VKNRLKVNPDQKFEDPKIAGSVREALANDPLVDKYQIDVWVVGGVAYLSGTVDSLFEKTLAEFAASKVKGVVDVKNKLKVMDFNATIYDPLVDDFYFYDPKLEKMGLQDETELLQDINSQLFWSPFVDADQVKVAVDGSVVTLTGTVDSRYEKEIAAKNAFDGGASMVFNNLKVK
jgi:osmotically-inducible protein OsmY